MGLIHVRIKDELEERVRDHVRRKGDLTRIIEEALELWLSKVGSAQALRKGK